MFYFFSGDNYQKYSNYRFVLVPFVGLLDVLYSMITMKHKLKPSNIFGYLVNIFLASLPTGVIMAFFHISSYITEKSLGLFFFVPMHLLVVAIAVVIVIVTNIVTDSYQQKLYKDPYSPLEKERTAYRAVEEGWLGPNPHEKESFQSHYNHMERYDRYTLPKYALQALLARADRLAKEKATKNNDYYTESLNICESLMKIVPDDKEKALLYYYEGRAQQGLNKTPAAFNDSISTLKKNQQRSNRSPMGTRVRKRSR